MWLLICCLSSYMGSIYAEFEDFLIEESQIYRKIRGILPKFPCEMLFVFTVTAKNPI